MKENPKAPAQAQHSPLPWKVSEGNMGTQGDVTVDIYSGDRFICGIEGHSKEEMQRKGYFSPEEMNANAELIVRACNNAQRLADAIKHTLPIIGKMAVIEGGYIKCKLEPHDAESFHLVYSEMREALAEWIKSI